MKTKTSPQMPYSLFDVIPGVDTPAPAVEAVGSSESTKRGGVPMGCARCRATRTALGAAHCGSCHRTFSTANLFDRHRSERGDHGRCIDPETLTNTAGERVMFFRDSMWRGPQMDEAAKAKAFGADS